MRSISCSKLARDTYNRSLIAKSVYLRRHGQTMTEVPNVRNNMVITGTLDAVGRDYINDELYADHIRNYRWAFYSMMGAHPDGDQLYTGEITPAYSSLSMPEIQRLHQLLPRPKIILMIRNPADRFVSALHMAWRFGNVEDVNDLDRVKRMFEGAFDQTRSLPTQILHNFSSVYGRKNILTVFFDDIVNQPQETRDQVVRFITGSTDVGHFGISATHNKKVNKAKADMADSTVDYIRALFREELERCKVEFGEKAGAW